MTTSLAQALLAEDAREGFEAVCAGFHEAGHLVAIIYQGHPLEDAAIWLEPGGGGSGIVRHGPDPDGGAWIDQDQIPGQIIGAYAGAEAEAVVLERLLGWSPGDAMAHAYGPSAAHDLDNALRVAGHYDGTLHLERLAARAGGLVRDFWRSVEGLADALMEHQYLTADQLYAVAA